MGRKTIMETIAKINSEIKSVSTELQKVHKLTREYAAEVREKSAVVFTAEQIQARIKELADQLIENYQQGTDPVLITLLDGGIPFARDLQKELDSRGYIYTPATMQVASYDNKMEGGEVKITSESKVPLGGRHVVVLDDVCDSAHTWMEVRSQLENNVPASLALMALVDKEPPKPRKDNYVPEYTGFKAGRLFLIGYGLDFCKQLRNTCDIRTVGFELDKEKMAAIETVKPLNSQLKQLHDEKRKLESKLALVEAEKLTNPGRSKHTLMAAPAPTRKEGQVPAAGMSYSGGSK
ncbi:hypoxanthine-guanine phosphoribosyltransferase [Legionella birminghamensis]|uniref:Hypoxanthine phosphoribosyltransferase n=1 Tax=Legionella birminghamensis TaxID=28083 RepID=A0A378I981_9GAMM|nr:phosphoribosyltransferase family protein [Legionella birminghamensis]KTC74867.1 hypoxanthine-guanine phosphoribosyltransferase [Legionella birminghamensis]STX31768.1 hypoxanthine phosphoribosyltransferase [Legionella birminghamensis]